MQPGTPPLVLEQHETCDIAASAHAQPPFCIPKDTHTIALKCYMQPGMYLLHNLLLTRIRLERKDTSPECQSKSIGYRMSNGF